MQFMIEGLTVVIPTKGRPTLLRCLQSIAVQTVKPDVLVVIDTFGPTPEGYLTKEEVIDECAEFDVRSVYYNAGYSDWGYPQLEYGYLMGDCHSFIMNIGDDDVLVEDVFDKVMVVTESNGIKPYLFQAELHPSPHRGNKEPVLLWNDHDRSITRGKVTGQNLVVPNIPHLFGRMVDDFEFIRATIERWHGLVQWVPIVTSRCY